MVVDMTRGRPGHLILRFAGPLLIGNIFQQLYNFTDTIVVGRCIGDQALAAVGTTGTVLFLMTALAMGLSSGASIIIAQYVGVKDFKQIRSAIAAIFYITLFLTFDIMGIGYWGAPWLLKFLKVPAEIMPDALSYLRICLVGVAGSTFYNGAAAILRSMGDGKTPLYAMIGSAVVNLGLNLYFILVWHMGVEGVAYGTIIAQVVGAFICIGHLYRYRQELHLDEMQWQLEWHMVKLILHTGIPSALQSCMISLGALSVQGLVNQFGTATMAAYAAVQKVDGVVIQVVVALGTALSVFTGQNIGSQNDARIREALRSTLKLMLAACSLLAVLCLGFKSVILKLILGTQATEAISIGCTYMTIIGIAYLIAGVMNSYLHLIRGAGDVNVCFAAGMAELAGRIFFAYLLVGPLGTTGIWLATPLSWGCGCIIPVLRYYSGKWRTQNVVICE